MNNKATTILLGSEETQDKIMAETIIQGTRSTISFFKTFFILLLLLIPFIMGLKITLFSRDKYVRLYFVDAHMGEETVPDLIWGLSNAMFPIGGGIGALGISYISNLIGRKYSVFLCVIIGIIGEIFLIASYYTRNYIFFVVSRFFDGLSSGGSMNAGICYLFDLLPSSSVSCCKPLVQLFINFGLFISALFSLDSIVHKNWIITSIPVTAVQIALAIILIFLPESPQDLYKKTKDASKTRKIIAQIRGSNYAGIEDELNLIIAEDQKNATIKYMSVINFLRDKTLAASILVMSVIQLFQQFSGINAVIYYANDFMKKSHFEREDIGVLLMIMLCLIGSIIFAPFLTKFSPKTMLLVGYSGMSFFFFAAFLAWMFLAPPLLIVFCLGAYLFIFQAGPGPQPWVIIMGTYELEQRISAQGFFTFLNWSANAIVLVVYMGISKPLDFYVSLIFGGINLFTFLFLWIFMIDPLRKSPTQILAEYRSKIPIFN